MDEQTVWSAPLDERGDRALGPAVATGAVTALVSLLAVRPWLVNDLGPFEGRAGLGLLVSLLLGVLAGLGVGVLARTVLARSRVGFVVLVVALAAAAVVLFPTRIDRHESFVEQPNERSSCTGVTFRHYPPDTMDASSTVYCVGMERTRQPG